jgi:hypothetical protein
MRIRIELSEGDVSSLVFDDATKRLEIYDAGRDPLIQAQLTDETRAALASILQSNLLQGDQ